MHWRGVIFSPATLFGAGHQAGIRSEVADGGKSVDVADLVEDHQGEDLADAWGGLQKIEGLGVVISGILQNEQFQGIDQFVVVI